MTTNNSHDSTSEDNSELMDKYYESMDEANKVKFGTTTGQEILQAAKNGDLETIKRLMSLPVEKGGLLLLRLIARDESGNSALDLATKYGHKDIVKYLNTRTKSQQ